MTMVIATFTQNNKKCKRPFMCLFCCYSNTYKIKFSHREISSELIVNLCQHSQWEATCFANMSQAKHNFNVGWIFCKPINLLVYFGLLICCLHKVEEWCISDIKFAKHVDMWGQPRWCDRCNSLEIIERFENWDLSETCYFLPKSFVAFFVLLYKSFKSSS